MRRCSCVRPVRGQALVESALILPILLTLAIGVMDVGFGFYVWVQVVNSSREGARAVARTEYRFDQTAAANQTSRENQGRTAARAALGRLNSAAATVTITYPSGGLTSAVPGGLPARVEVSYPYALPVSSVLGFIDDTLTLRSSTTMLVRNDASVGFIGNCDTDNNVGPDGEDLDDPDAGCH